MPICCACLVRAGQARGRRADPIARNRRTQHIPKRFLENILNELRRGGFVESKRGKEGGFKLNRPAHEISIGDVVRFIEESVHPVECVADQLCPLTGRCIFIGLWEEAKRAVEQVYDQKKLDDLVREEAKLACNNDPVIRNDTQPEA